MIALARSTAYRLAVGCALLGILFLTWLNLAVGIIGSEDNPANLMYVGMLAIGAAAHSLFAFARMQWLRLCWRWH